MSVEIPDIKDYRQRWSQTTREHILPQRTTKQYELEGKTQASELQENIDPSWTVLDYGSGTGRVIKNIDAAKRYALDVNIRSLRQTPPGITQLLSDGLTIPLETDSIDYIFSLMVLQHCTKKHHLPILTEMVRVLKPGGKALIQLPKDDAYYTQTQGVNVYTDDEIKLYVPSNASYALTVDRLVMYADGFNEGREWFLTLTKGK
jgi:ubiquinone/menaquinone biosynthesis C-methylase UbiE